MYSSSVPDLPASISVPVYYDTVMCAHNVPFQRPLVFFFVFLLLAPLALTWSGITAAGELAPSAPSEQEVEGPALRLLATFSQSAGLSGRKLKTYRHKAKSSLTSQRNPGIAILDIRAS